MPNYLTEFPSFVLDVDIPEGFEDTSDNDNITPSWKKDSLHLYVDFINEDDRSSSGQPRFSLFKETTPGQLIQDYTFLVETDDYNEILIRI